MMRAAKLIVVLVLMGLVALTIYAYLADLAPTPQEIREPVTLNGG
jgi:uncharacterized membrane protein YdjX (TVP38/TMEM64 family)